MAFLSYSSQTLDFLPDVSSPPSKFMGSKRAILPFIFRHIDRLQYDTVFDPFSGSGAVAFEFKRRSKQVTTNDFLHFSYLISKALIENNRYRLSDEQLAKLLLPRQDANSVVRDNFANVFFTMDECFFLDSLWSNIQDLNNEYQRALAIAAACYACQKKYPRGIFTVAGGRGADDRPDFNLSLKEQFLRSARLYNASVFDNRRQNRAFCMDTSEFTETDFDLVYFDPPYWSPLSDNDYVRRYHFIEGYSLYWKGLHIQTHSKSRKFQSYPSLFSKLGTTRQALRDLFRRFSNSILAISYSSNSKPDKEEIAGMLKDVKGSVETFQTSHVYSFGNQNSKIREKNNRVTEYLFIAK